MPFARRTAAAMLAAAQVATIALFLPARAEQAASVTVSVKNDSFIPEEITAPANRPIAIRVKNLDAEEIEFESVSLRVEKVIAAKSEGVVNVRALAPGRYEFFDDFHQKARGTLVVK